MCRLLGLLSPDDRPAKPWLLDSELSLLRQSDIDPEHPQGDGWGVAWRKGPEIILTKGIAGAHAPSERPRFVKAAEDARGPLVIAHLRKASNPMNLPKEKLWALENSQPFIEGEVIFAHNGAIPLPRETRERLGRYASSPKGLNDSEVYFYLLLKCLEGEKDPPRAYVRAIKELKEVWEKNGKPGEKPHSGLNIIFSRSPKELWAFCHYTGEHGTSLSGIKRPYYEMCYREENGAAVVASEPTDRNEASWNPIASGRYMRATLADGRVMTECRDLPEM
jgi:predicted glutamine amidotransferase